MRDTILNIIEEYLLFFSEEKERQSKLINYLNNHDDNEIVDWNNFDGHLVAGGFIYARKERKFLVLYHQDLKMFLYPGGHIDNNDMNPLQAAEREIAEETGLKNLKQVTFSKNKLIPIDIDTHIISYNERLDLPEHYHFDFRYLFMIDNISSIVIDSSEISNYKWIDIDELKNDLNYGKVVTKVKNIYK